MPGNNQYVIYNPDDVDHMLVDPAYWLEKIKEMNEKYITLMMALTEVDNQMTGYFAGS